MRRQRPAYLVRTTARGVGYWRIVRQRPFEHVKLLGRVDKVTPQELAAARRKYGIDETRSERSLRLAKAQQEIEEHTYGRR